MISFQKTLPATELPYMLAVIALAQLLHTCAPTIAPKTMTAIVSVESGGNVLALHDNTLGRSFAPVNAVQAVAWSNSLIALGHSLDLGLSQINSTNLPRLGLSVPAAFDPCRNLSAGATILASDYRVASARFGEGQVALRRALGAYNSGSLYAGRGYVNRILAASGVPIEPLPQRDYAVAVAPPIARATQLWRRRSPAAKRATPSFTIVRSAGVEVIVGTP